MSIGGEGLPGAARKSPELAGVRILAITATGAGTVADALLAVLQAAQDVEAFRIDLPAGNCTSRSSVFSDAMRRFQPTLLALCLSAPEMEVAEAVFEGLGKSRKGTSVVVLAEGKAVDHVHRLIGLGAADFALAPLRVEDILPRIYRWSSPVSPADGIGSELKQRLGLRQFLGKSPIFLDAIAQIPKLARCGASVFITGETGTGKEMCARAIHHLGPRGDRPFVPVNCGAIPSELVENELFGHEAGAFTSASAGVRGLVYDAEGGTLFLDEIDSLPVPTQVKLLRFLQDQEYRPLGSRRTFQADVRIIAASNAEIEPAILSQRFRSDLFYRLSVLPLKLPALRERREDIPLLARHFLVKHAPVGSNSGRELSPAAITKLVNYEWPGNVRELENVIERTVILSERFIISGEDVCLPAHRVSAYESSFKALKQRAIAEFETSYIRQLLASSDGNISQAARTAKKNRRAFWHLMRKYEIAVPRTMITR
jgi:DNA-binding NtrC family response regulator